MKKSIFVVFLFLAFVPVYAQNSGGSLWKFYALAGATGSTVGGNGDSWSGLLPGYQAGAGFLHDIGVPGHYVLNGETNITSCGSKYKSNYSGGEGGAAYSGKVLLTYLNLAMLLQYRMQSGFYGEVGLQPGLLLSAKDKGENYNENYKPYTKSVDVGIPIGVGYLLLRSLALNFRYCHGITNVAKNTGGGDDVVRNRVFAFRLLWMLGQ
jgi:Outer membrane protein beta-barrel domain